MLTRELLNTLYVMTPGATVVLDHETLKVRSEGETLLQVPLIHLGTIVLFERANITGEALRYCAAEGRAIVFMDYAGRFRARVQGPTTGNVLLRKAQFEALIDATRSREISRRIVAAKVRNSRLVLMRGARDAKAEDRSGPLRVAAARLAENLASLESAEDAGVIRGIEGAAASAYFGAFPNLLAVSTEDFAFRTRTRRPPRDRMNALLSFLYSLVTADCQSAAEGVGLDPQVGYLHVLRPGRPALALDFAEELRAVVADRLALSLVNRRQLRPEHFEVREGGGTLLNDTGRKLVLTAYQKRKREEVPHLLLDKPVPVGLIPHLQARLLARHLRGDLEEYPPFVAQS